MSTAVETDAHAEDVIPGTNFTRGQLRERMARLSLEDRQRLARGYVRQRGRSHSPETRARISEKLATLRREQALAAEYVHPLRAARLKANGGRGLTQKALSERALVDASVIQSTEAGHQPSPLTLKRLARALSTSPEALTE